MTFDENLFIKVKKAQGKMDSVQEEQFNQAVDSDCNILKERLDFIELELIQVKQRLEVLENQVEEPEDPADTINIDGGNFMDTSFKRIFDGGLFTEPHSGKNIDGGEFNG